MSKPRDFCFCKQPRSHGFHHTIIRTNEYFARCGNIFFPVRTPPTPLLRPPKRTGKSTPSNNQILVSTNIDAVINTIDSASPVEEITSFTHFIAEIRPPSPRSTRVEGQKRPILGPQNGSNAPYLVDEMSKPRDFCFCEQPRNHSFHRTIIGTNEYFARSGNIFFPVRTPRPPTCPPPSPGPRLFAQRKIMEKLFSGEWLDLVDGCKCGDLRCVGPRTDPWPARYGRLDRPPRQNPKNGHFRAPKAPNAPYPADQMGKSRDFCFCAQPQRGAFRH